MVFMNALLNFSYKQLAVYCQFNQEFYKFFSIFCLLYDNKSHYLASYNLTIFIVDYRYQ